MRKTNCCEVPTPIAPKELELWKKIHSVKCDRNRESHRCRGKITIDAKSVTLQCPVCGDARQLLQDLDD